MKEYGVAVTLACSVPVLATARAFLNTKKPARGGLLQS